MPHNAKLLQAVVDALPAPFFVFDADGYYLEFLAGMDEGRHQDGRNLIGKRLHDVMEASLADSCVEQIRSVLKQNRPTTFIYQLAATDMQGSEQSPSQAGKQWFEAHISPIRTADAAPEQVLWIAFNITQRQQALIEKQQLITILESTMREIKTLQGILPICSYCKKIRDAEGNWITIEHRISWRLDANLSHGICPSCAKEHFSEYMTGTE